MRSVASIDEGQADFQPRLILKANDADAEGKASFSHSFKPCLQMTGEWITSMLAIAYHSDGKTYGAYPGDFGLNAHVPLFLMLPNRKGIE